MVFQGNSQDTLQESPDRVFTYVNELGDTMVSMGMNDAKILLEDVLHYKYTDSLLKAYKVKDSLNIENYVKQKKIIFKLSELTTNQKEIIKNLEEVINNKDNENEKKDDIINQQDKEIKKQKILKKIGFSGSVILPVLLLILLL